MPFDKKIWEQSIGFVSVDNLPAWPCPACQDGELVVDQSALSYQVLKTQFNVEDFNSDAFEEGFLMGLLSIAATYTEVTNWTQARYVGFLSCNGCGAVVSFTGRAKLPIAKPQQTYTLQRPIQILPEYFSPSLPIIPLPSSYPKKIRLELIRSFSLFFNDSASASNRLRTAIEQLLEDQGIPRARIGDDGQPEKNKYGKTNYRSLHDRITDFKTLKNCDLGEILLAVKVLGNEGTHGSDLSKTDLLEAYNVIDYVLNEIYVRSLRHQEVLRKSTALANKYC